jgi:Cu/Ag efflux pump CusA
MPSIVYLAIPDVVETHPLAIFDGDLVRLCPSPRLPNRHVVASAEKCLSRCLGSVRNSHGYHRVHSGQWSPVNPVRFSLDLVQLRSTQDWQLRYALAKAEGVAEVASVGGFVKQYSVIVDPRLLQSFGLSLSTVRYAIRASNMDTGGRTVEISETEYAVRGRGLFRNTKDIESIVLKADGGTPVLLRDVARVEFAPYERRGITELNGEGEVAGGIAIQRYGENALSVIDNMKARLAF